MRILCVIPVRGGSMVHATSGLPAMGRRFLRGMPKSLGADHGGVRGGSQEKL